MKSCSQVQLTVSVPLFELTVIVDLPKSGLGNNEIFIQCTSHQKGL